MIEKTKIYVEQKEISKGVTVKDIPPRSFFYHYTSERLWYKISDDECINFESDAYLSPLNFDAPAIPVKEVTISAIT